MAPGTKGSLDIARNARAINWVKAELLGGVADLYKSILRGGDELVLETLASIIIATYVLARRLGISFETLEAKVLNKLRVNISENHQIEAWYGDLSGLRNHIEQKR